MIQRIETLRAFIRAEKHHQFRHSPEEFGLDRLCENFQVEGMAPVERSARMLKALLNAETPIIIEGETIVATRTITRIPSIFTEEEWAEIRSKHTLHERGTVSNLSPDYEGILKDGLGVRKTEVEDRLKDESLTEDQRLFLNAAHASLEAVQDFIKKYRDCARNSGLDDVAKTLDAIHTASPATLYEALQLLRIVHFALWAHLPFYIRIIVSHIKYIFKQFLPFLPQPSRESTLPCRRHAPKFYPHLQGNFPPLQRRL